MSRSHAPCAAVSILLATAVRLHATVLVPASLEELTRDALTIARGRIVAVDARRADDRQAIETMVTLEVETYLKGSLGPTLQFVVPGGVVGRYRAITIGAPGFTVGERVIVFLGGRAPALPHILGFNQGVFRVVTRHGSVARNPEPVVVSAGTPGSTRPSSGPVALEAFERHVRARTGARR